jgi:uncharacterized protein
MSPALRLLDNRPVVIGMIHVLPLPGTPRWAGDFEAVVARAAEEACVLREAGVDALMLENMHDVPYLKGEVGAEITAAMAVLGRTVKLAGLPTGVQILAGANRQALAVALAARLDFVRVEGFVFGHLADEGYIDACAGELLRYRRAIGAEHVSILADIKKKHASHAVTADVDIAEMARAAAFFGADGVIVTGSSTGVPADPDELARVKAATPGPVLVGSGVTIDNLERYLPHCDGVIVGSHLKADGRWENPVFAPRVEAFMARVRELRGGPR